MTSLTAVENGRELTRGEREASDPELEGLVREIIGRVADKWTMLALETLEEHGRLRFTRLGELVGGVIPQEMRGRGADAVQVQVVEPRPKALDLLRDLRNVHRPFRQAVPFTVRT